MHLIVTAADFEIAAGEDCLETYTFNTGVARHYFCRHCGVAPFYVPRSHPDGFSANLRCLAPDVWSTFEVEPFDGQAWERNVATIHEPEQVT